MQEHKCPKFIVCIQAATILALVAATNALAGPPLLTDDPDTPGPGHWEINVAWTTTKESDKWEMETPLLDANYGIGERLELTYEVPWAIAHQSGVTASGLGNSLVGMKWRFLDQDKHWLDISTYPQFEFNNSGSSVARGLVDPGWTGYLPFEFEHKFGRLTSYIETGFIWNQRRPNAVLYGIASEYQINDKFSLCAEVHGEDENRLQEDHVVFNLGFTWKLTEKLNFIGSAGRALQDSSGSGPEFLSYLGLQFCL
ncbi:MAG TPA: hypothetical protein VGN61_05815 [Verrucomicrobiae bacterium]